MTEYASPQCMRDPQLAVAVAERDGWEHRCLIDGCPTRIQGGRPGMEAHLRVVHQRTLAQPR